MAVVVVVVVMMWWFDDLLVWAWLLLGKFGLVWFVYNCNLVWFGLCITAVWFGLVCVWLGHKRQGKGSKTTSNHHTMTQTNTTTAIPAIVMTNTAANTAALSAATTPAGSAYSSPAVSVKGLAPKKLLVRQPLKASFKIKSRTVFPSTEQPVKVPNAQMIRGKEEDQLPIVRGTDAHEDV